MTQFLKIVDIARNELGVTAERLCEVAADAAVPVVFHFSDVPVRWFQDQPPRKPWTGWVLPWLPAARFHKLDAVPDKSLLRFDNAPILRAARPGGCPAISWVTNFDNGDWGECEATVDGNWDCPAPHINADDLHVTSEGRLALIAHMGRTDLLRPAVAVPDDMRPDGGQGRQDRLLTLLAAAATVMARIDRKTRTPSLSTDKGRPNMAEIARVLASECGSCPGYLDSPIADDLGKGLRLLNKLTAEK